MENTPMLISKPEKAPRLRRLVSRNRFSCRELEDLYGRYIYKLRQSALQCLLALFTLLTLVLAVLNFAMARYFTVLGLYLAVQWVAFSALLLFASTRFMEERHLPIVSYVVLVFLVCFAAFALPLDFGITMPGRDAPPSRSPVDGVWEAALVVFMVYSLMPVRTLVTVVVGVTLPAMHMVVSVFVANTFPEMLWRQTSAEQNGSLLLELPSSRTDDFRPLAGSSRPRLSICPSAALPDSSGLHMWPLICASSGFLYQKKCTPASVVLDHSRGF